MLVALSMYCVYETSAAHLQSTCVHTHIHEYIRRSSNDAPPATKVLPLRSQKSIIERGASFAHMTLLQRIVSEQWYPAECRQRVPTAKSVTKTLSKCICILRTCMANEHMLYLVLSTYTYVYHACMHMYVITVCTVHTYQTVHA